MKSEIFGFEVRYSAQRIGNPCKFHWQAIQNPVPGMRNLQCGIQSLRLPFKSDEMYPLFWQRIVVWQMVTANPLLSAPLWKKPPPSNKPLPPFQGRKVNNRPSLLTPQPSPLSFFTFKLHVKWSRLFYSTTGSSDLLLILGCMTSNFSYLRFSTLHSSSFGRTDNMVFAELNKPPPSQISLPSPLSHPFPLKCGWNK